MNYVYNLLKVIFRKILSNTSKREIVPVALNLLFVTHSMKTYDIGSYPYVMVTR